MDDTEDDARYPPNPYGVNHQQGYGSSNRQKIPARGGSYTQPIGNHYGDEDEEDDEEEDEVENENVRSNGYLVLHKDVVDVDDDDDDDDDGEDDENDIDDEDVENGDHGKRKNYGGRSDNVDLERHPKKRKLKSLVSSYEFAPRVPTPAVAAMPSSSTIRQSFGGRNSLTDWTERETFVLLDAWGERFIQRGKKSLRSEEWQEVSEKVSEVSKVDRTDTQCRNRLDTLKKKYKKEKLNSSSSKWVYFKKMDLLLSTSSQPQQPGLSCGLDSGEYVFMNPRVYLNRANGLDEMRDSPGNSESSEGDDGDDSDGLPPKKRKFGKKNKEDNDAGSSIRLLANSIHKFSEIYEKIETSKRQHMVEIEKMRMDFQRDLEIQRRQIMESAQAEIAKIRRGEEEYFDAAENESG